MIDKPTNNEEIAAALNKFQFSFNRKQKQTRISSSAIAFRSMLSSFIFANVCTTA